MSPSIFEHIHTQTNLEPVPAAADMDAATDDADTVNAVLRTLPNGDMLRTNEPIPPVHTLNVPSREIVTYLSNSPSCTIRSHMSR